MSRLTSVISIVFLVVGFAGWTPAPAQAQAPDSARAPGQPLDSTTVIPLPPLVVTATGTPLAPGQVGFALSVVGQGELEVEKPVYAFDALRDVPGAYIDEASGPGGPTIVRLRGGEEVFTQILVDGVQANENGGFFDMQGMALSNLQRIEVARGPQSAVYGSSAVSGVVQFLTPPGQPGRTQTEARLEGGGASENGGSFRGSGRLSGGSETLRYSAGGGAAYNRGIYDIAHDTWSWDGSLRLDWLPADRWEVTTMARLFSYEGDLPVRDAGATRVPLDPNARNERDRIVSSVEAAFAATSDWTHRLRAALFWQDFLFSDEADPLPATPFFVPNFNLDYESSFLRPTLEYSGTYRIRPGGRDGGVTLTYGVLWEKEDFEDELTGDFEGGDSFDRESWAGYGEVLLGVLPRTSLLLGARMEKFQGLETEVTPRMSAVVDALPGRLSLRGAWGEAYKAPNLQQQYTDNPFIQGNPNLEPERSDSWELGFDARGAGGRVSFGLTYFDQEFEDLIRTVLPEGETRSINRNLGSASARGVEWRARVRPSPRWLLGTDGAWVETEIGDNTGLSPTEFPEGEALPFRPDLTGSVFVQARPHEDVTLLLRGLYVGEQTVLSERFSGQREELDPYFLTGLTLHYRFSDAVTVYTRLENLLDEEYETAFDRRGIPPSIAVGVDLSSW